MAKATHANDHGLEVGDDCFYMANGWIPVPCKVLAKSGQGMTRTMRLEMDEKSTGGRAVFSQGIYTNNLYQYSFWTSVKKIRPR